MEALEVLGGLGLDGGVIRSADNGGDKGPASGEGGTGGDREAAGRGEEGALEHGEWSCGEQAGRGFGCVW